MVGQHCLNSSRQSTFRRDKTTAGQRAVFRVGSAPSRRRLPDREAVVSPKNMPWPAKERDWEISCPKPNANASNCEASKVNSWVCTVPLCTGARRERAIRNVVQTYTRKIRRRGRKMDGWKTGIRERKLVRLWGIRPAALVNFQRCGPVHFFSSSSIIFFTKGCNVHTMLT